MLIDLELSIVLFIVAIESAPVSTWELTWLAKFEAGLSNLLRLFSWLNQLSPYIWEVWLIDSAECKADCYFSMSSLEVKNLLLYSVSFGS